MSRVIIYIQPFLKLLELNSSFNDWHHVPVNFKKIGGLGKMRRNNENTYSFIQATHQEVMDLKATVANIISKLDNIALQVQKATFKTLMDDSPDISEFFPVERAEQIENFMDRSHPDWPSRRSQFYSYLFNIVTDSKKNFTKGLLKALFRREYMRTVKWPSSGWDAYKINLYILHKQ